LKKEKNDAIRELSNVYQNQSVQDTSAKDFQILNEKLKQKREELAEQIEINAKIEEENRFLIEENEEMERKMQQASAQMLQMGDQYEKMKDLYGTRDIHSEQILTENESLRAQIEQLQENLKLGLLHALKIRFRSKNRIVKGINFLVYK